MDLVVWNAGVSKNSALGLELLRIADQVLAAQIRVTKVLDSQKVTFKKFTELV